MCSHNCFRVFEKLWRDSLQALVAAANATAIDGHNNRLLSEPAASSTAANNFYAKLSKAFGIDNTNSAFPMKRKRRKRRRKLGTLQCQLDLLTKQKSSFLGVDTVGSGTNLKLRSVVR